MLVVKAVSDKESDTIISSGLFSLGVCHLINLIPFKSKGNKSDGARIFDDLALSWKKFRSNEEFKKAILKHLKK